ncbi:MAG: hypothetical protein K8S23_14840 [Candidatus Cloacimonetes bacterium]|nr:hypothetical protein [Candidatus Cloacimonadota bacterium]
MKKILIGSFFILILSFLNGESQELRPYKLINADTLFINKINEEYITFLTGNVHFFYGETEFYSDKAEIFEKKKISKLIGNVEVYDDTLSLFSDQAEYFRIPDLLKLNGDVFVKEVHTDSTIRTFNAEFVDYDRKNSNIHTWKNVRVYDEKEDFRGFCGESFYYLEKNYGYLIKNPYCYVSGEDSLKISAQKIEYFKDYKKIVGSFDVDTYSQDFQVTSNFLLYFSEENKAIYLGNPILYSEFADAKAKEFQLFFDEENITKAILNDSCKISYKLEENGIKENWVTSDKMEIFFRDNKLNRCLAFDNIDSFYIQEKIDDKDYTENKVTGSNLVISFDLEDKVENIFLTNRVNGVYKFEKQ